MENTSTHSWLKDPSLKGRSLQVPTSPSVRSVKASVIENVVLLLSVAIGTVLYTNTPTKNEASRAMYSNVKKDPDAFSPEERLLIYQRALQTGLKDSEKLKITTALLEMEKLGDVPAGNGVALLAKIAPVNRTGFIPAHSAVAGAHVVSIVNRIQAAQDAALQKVNTESDAKFDPTADVPTNEYRDAEHHLTVGVEVPFLKSLKNRDTTNEEFVTWNNMQKVVTAFRYTLIERAIRNKKSAEVEMYIQKLLEANPIEIVQLMVSLDSSQESEYGELIVTTTTESLPNYLKVFGQNLDSRKDVAVAYVVLNNAEEALRTFEGASRQFREVQGQGLQEVPVGFSMFSEEYSQFLQKYSSSLDSTECIQTILKTNILNIAQKTEVLDVIGPRVLPTTSPEIQVLIKMAAQELMPEVVEKYLVSILKEDPGLYPPIVATLNTLGIVKYSTVINAVGTDALARAKRLNPTNPTYVLGEAKLFAAQGDWYNAHKTLENIHTNVKITFISSEDRIEFFQQLAVETKNFFAMLASSAAPATAKGVLNNTILLKEQEKKFYISSIELTENNNTAIAKLEQVAFTAKDEMLKASAYNNLAWSMLIAERGKVLDIPGYTVSEKVLKKALEYAKVAVDIQSNNPDIQDTFQQIQNELNK